MSDIRYHVTVKIKLDWADPSRDFNEAEARHLLQMQANHIAHDYARKIEAELSKGDPSDLADIADAEFTDL